MRIPLDLDDHMVSSLLALHPNLSETEAVEMAIRDHLERGVVARLRRRAGSIAIEDVSGQLRSLDRST